MPLSEDDYAYIEEFRSYIEDSVAHDDRYGAATRDDRDDESTLATRFEAGPACWLEVAICPHVPQIRVGFLTDDEPEGEGIEQAIRDSGTTVETLVEFGFAEVGLNWPQPPVEHESDGEHFCSFATPFEVDELRDLDSEANRNKTLRMLEGYLVAFGPVIIDEDDEGEAIDDE